MIAAPFLAALSGVLLTLAFPPFSVRPVAWVALVPLLLALRDVAPGRAAFLGWLTGTVGSLGVTGYWMYRAAADYFGVSPLLAASFTFVVNQVFVSLYFALFASAVARLGIALPPRVAILFVASEYARANLLGGNPWALLGQSQDIPLLMQVCDLGGVYLLGFLIAWVNASLASLGASLRPLGPALVGLAVAVGYGGLRLYQGNSLADTSVSVGLVQGAIPNDQRGEPRFFSAQLQAYVDLSAPLAAQSPALLVWPEYALGFFPEDNVTQWNKLASSLEGNGQLLFGAPRGASSHQAQASLYNSAYLLGPDTSRVGTGFRLRHVYDKRRLLPFIEAWPLRPQDGPYLPGSQAGLFEVSGHRIGALICYEALYAALARDTVNRGAKILANLSNDSWFDAGAGPEQHFQAARFRAVENHVALLRVTNSGVSAVVDPNGREILRLPAKRPAAALAQVPVGSGDSFYARHGDVFALSCVALGLASLAKGRR